MSFIDKTHYQLVLRGAIMSFYRTQPPQLDVYFKSMNRALLALFATTRIEGYRFSANQKLNLLGNSQYRDLVLVQMEISFSIFRMHVFFWDQFYPLPPVPRWAHPHHPRSSPPALIGDYYPHSKVGVLQQRGGDSLSFITSGTRIQEKH